MKWERFKLRTARRAYLARQSANKFVRDVLVVALGLAGGIFLVELIDYVV